MGDDAWMGRADCRKLSNPDPLFFPKTTKGLRPNYSLAKTICYHCPVRRTCFAYAIAHREYHGVWGGFSPTERKAIPREVKRKISALWF